MGSIISQVIFHFVIILILVVDGSTVESSLGLSRQVFADVTSNKLSREYDGTWGLWSYHGVAEESHATKTQFVFNADLVSETDGHHQDIASMVYPALGLASDQDPAYQEYLLLQAKVLGIDGLLIEWGYRGHSSDNALQSYLQLAKKHSNMKIGVNWCDHWLMSTMTNKTETEIVKTFHENLQYLISTAFVQGPSLTPFFDNHPVIFLFGGGLTPKLFKEIISLPLDLPKSLSGLPVWIGSYLNFASSESLREEWKGLINGTFGWSPYVLKPTPPSLQSWDFYGDLSDVLAYQKNVTSFGNQCLSDGDCLIWCGSVSPGFDNRGCAGWGRELRLIPRQDLETHKRSTYDAQWDYYIQGNISTNTIIIPTMNDFPESTPIVALNDSNFSLKSTSLHIKAWKNLKADDKGIYLPQEWYRLQKAIQYYGLTPGVNVSSLFAYLNTAGQAIDNQDYTTASDELQTCRSQLESLISHLHSNNMTIHVPSPSMSPSIPPMMMNGSYVINGTAGLYLTLDSDTSKILVNSNYKGLLHFWYLPLNSSLNYLKVFSPTKRKDAAFKEDKIFLSRRNTHLPNVPNQTVTNLLTIVGDFAEVCSLVTNSSSGTWHKATVEMYKINQSWEHAGPYKSDLHFESLGAYLVQNISLEFQVISS
ncbi:uncharacterized protein [Apostichopus japonicus]|uniref:uncharacterized protein isoform X1 n=1 Tax=Stichopus japonicus TaxID=307972 RepID=UPI003AB68D68